MPAPRPNESPRSYPPAVTLMRRADRGPAAAPTKTSIAEIEAWLVGDAMRETDLLPLLESLYWRMVAADLPLDRASLHVGTLHPQLIGFAWNWNRPDGLCDEVKVAESVLSTDSYRRNPLYRVIEYGETVRVSPQEPSYEGDTSLVGELAAQGITDYIALPIGGGAYHNAATAATQRPAGFSDADVEALRRLLRLFALHVERHIVLRIADNVLDTYLGSVAGAQVLGGSIKRGAGESIRAVIWMSDLRGFTGLTDRLTGAEVTSLLNAYFEQMVGAVIAHDGEVLKFIGDGLLAVFPFDAFEDERSAAASSLAAAEQALARVDALNAEPPPEIFGIEGWRPLRSGIALHEGEVFFGNVGAPERLDFTVIGRAVNEAARVEALTKELGRPILITDPVAQRLDRPLDDLGKHPLRGVGAPMAIFSPS